MVVTPQMSAANTQERPGRIVEQATRMYDLAMPRPAPESRHHLVRLIGLVSLVALAGCTSGELGGGTPNCDGCSVYDSPSMFGMVHGDDSDATLSLGWNKSIWTPQAWNGTTVSAAYWRSRTSAAYENGVIEVPVVAGDTWDSGDLAKISDMMTQFFEAEPRVPVWELGLEENLERGWEANLPQTARKIAAVRDVKQAINPDIRLVYQVANRGKQDIETFLASEAADHIDILALHPYSWPDFEAPETWLAEWISVVESLLTKLDLAFPIWFTEIGAPQNDDNVPQMYSGSSPIRGQGQQENARYIVKLHVIAFHAGVEKVFWYNYVDRCSDSTDAECHFGIKSDSGAPKPAYRAYKAMRSCIGVKGPATADASAPTRVYSFAGENEDCLVVWNYPAGTTTAWLESIRPDLTAENTQATSLLGEPVAITDGSVTVSDEPLFLRVRR